MGVPLMIHEDDDKTIESLKKQLGAKTKIEVVRIGLQLLQEDLSRKERVQQWKKAVSGVKNDGEVINKEFQKQSRIKKVS